MNLLILRQNGVNENFVQWLRASGRFDEVQVIEARGADWSRLRKLCKPDVIVHWLNSPARILHPDYYRFALELRDRYPDAQTISPAWKHHTRSKMLELMGAAQTYLRIPAFLERCIVRDNLGSGGYIVEAGAQLNHRIAIEYIDTRCDDGLFRKYRWVQIGERGFPRHLVVAKHWNVHARNRIPELRYVREEARFLCEGLPPAEAYAFRELLQALGYDSAAFDYSCKGNQIVVWEANAHYTLANYKNESPEHRYQREAIEAIYSALADSYCSAV